VSPTRCETSPRWGSRCAAAILAALAALLLAASASAAPIADEAAVIYDPHSVAAIDLTLSSKAIGELEAEPAEYVKGTFSMATTSGGPEGTETPLTASPLSVEVRLKGSGSFRPITGKAAFKLKFKKAEPFLGLRKMTLNNMVQDDSMVHEALSYLAFGAAEVPAPRSGYAYLRLNGEDVGLYADVETLDKVALEKRFGSFEAPPQHLYEGENGHDVLPGEAEFFEADEGEEEEWDDLEALIEAVNGSGAEAWSTRVSPYADLQEMTRMWAVEHYIAHWDGYAGHREAGFRPNNYYLFSEASGRFQMLPWGTDQTWDLNLEIPHRIVSFDNEGGVMFNLCLEDEACRQLYWEALGKVTDAVEAIEPGEFLTSTAAMLAPWQQREREFGRPERTASQVEAALSETAEFIANRPAEAREWLAANEPPAPEEEGEEEPQTPPVLTPSPPGPSPAPGPPSGPGHLGRNKRAGSHLTLGIGLAGPASVRVLATMGREGRRVVACKGSADFAAGGRQEIVCTLSPAALERLSEHALPLRLRVAVFPLAGGREVLARSIRLTRS
jgi:hypothetical protein